MFLGHFAVAFAVKKATPKASLGTLFVAAQLPDVIWPVLVLTGVERVRVVPGITAATPLEFVSYPYSHSLLFVAVWAVVLAGVYGAVRRAPQAMPWIAAAVLSHWLLDLVSHRPDVPVLPGGPLLGLGLWHSLPATVLAEAALFTGGLLLYSRATAARNRAGTIGLWVLAAVLILTYTAAVFGPPPPSGEIVAWSGIGMWLYVAAAYWVDRQRQVRFAA